MLSLRSQTLKKPYNKAIDRPVFLVGLPLSGKTTIGGLLAAEIGYPFFDLDECVCQQAGVDQVATLFATQGEPYFRSLERSILSDFLKKNSPFVLATGGGTVCYNGAMEAICQGGDTIYLDISWELMAQRASSSALPSRPLLDRLDSRTVSELDRSYADRIKYYERAHIHFSITSDALQPQLQALCRLLHRHRVAATSKCSS